MARPGPVSALAPPARLIVLLLLTSTVFSAPPLPCLLLILAALLLLAFEGLHPLALLRELPGLILLCLLVLALEGLGWENGINLLPAGLASGGSYFLRLLAAFLFGRLFYHTTSSSELREATGFIGRILPGSLGTDLALSLSLVLGFVPMIVVEWTLSMEAGRARGLEGRSSVPLRLRVAEAFIRRLVLRATQLPEVLVARAWTGGRGIPSRPWGAGSWMAVLAASIFPLSELVRLVSAWI